MASRDEIINKVRASLVEALGVDEEEITPEATIMNDLGGESIDFLDIVFRLEKAFNIKIPRGELFPESMLSDETFVKDGRMTPEGLQEIKKKMPYANLSDFEKDPLIANFSNLFTVELICRYVESKI